jgi:hypothetical protein
MRRWKTRWTLSVLLLACGGSQKPALTPEEAKLAPSDHLTPHMCELMVDHIFDMIEEYIPQEIEGSDHGKSSIETRAFIERDRAKHKRPEALTRCAETYDRSNYDCVMRADTRTMKECLPGWEWRRKI